jgi:mRNA interferase MazF
LRRGEIWWASLRSPEGSDPGYRRPVIVVQADEFNESRIATVICAVVTTNLALAMAPGNVVLERKGTGLRTRSVANVSQLITVNKTALTKRLGRVPGNVCERLDAGLRLVLSL